MKIFEYLLKVNYIIKYFYIVLTKQINKMSTIFKALALRHQIR